MNQGISKACLGLRYFIKYAENANDVYFEVIKDCEKEIKLWCLITLFSNNMDDLWENVPDFIFEDLFLMKKIETPRGVLDYGVGYHSKSMLSFKEQFKYIRDKISHKSFRYENGLIFLDDEADTYFDFAWLEKLVLSTIANTKNDFRKGMSDVAIFSLMLPEEEKDFYKSWDLGLIHLYRVTLLTSNKNALANHFRDTGVQSNQFTFDLLFNAVKYKLGQTRINSKNFFLNPSSYLQQIFRDIENYFGGYVHLELVSNSVLDQWIKQPGFEDLSFQGKLQYLINRLKMEDVYAYNSIMVLNIFETLNLIEQGVFDIDHLYILRDAKDFFVKVYANILFSGIYARSDQDFALKQLLSEKYSFDMHFVHAKNVYKDYVRAIKRALIEARDYHAPGEYQRYLAGLMHHYEHLLEDAIENKDDQSLFWNLRNALVHNQTQFDGDAIRFYITGRNIPLKHFNKKKREWVSKEFVNQQIIWEMVIKEEELLKMMDELYELAGISTSVNIAKRYMKKKKDQRN